MHEKSNRVCSRKINSPYKIVDFDKKSQTVTKETADHIVNNLKLGTLNSSNLYKGLYAFHSGENRGKVFYGTGNNELENNMYRLYASNSEDIDINNLCKKDNGTVMKGNKIENVALCYRNCINPKISGTKYTHFSLKDNKCFLFN